MAGGSGPGQPLDVVPLEVEKWEPGLGTYKVPILKIGVGDAAVQVVPVGRNVVGTVSSLIGDQRHREVPLPCPLPIERLHQL